MRADAKRVRRVPARSNPGTVLSTRRQLAALLYAALLSVCLPVLMITTMPAAQDLGGLVLRLLPLLYASARLAAISWRADPQPFASVFWMFVYITLGVVPVAQYLLQKEQYYSLGLNAEYASAVILTGCVSFDVAYRVTKHSGANLTPRLIDEKIAVPPAYLGKRLRAFAVVALILALFYIATAGGPGAFFSSRQDLGIATADALVGEGAGESTRAFVAAFGKVAPLVSLLSYLVARRLQQLRFLLPDYLLTALLLSVVVVVNNPISNPRYWFLAVALGFLFSLSHSKEAHNLFITVGILAAILVFPNSDVTRYANAEERVGYGTVWETIAVKDFDQYTMIANAITFTEDRGFTFGRQLIGVVLFWVPRSIWPDKPLDSGVVFGQWLGMKNTNLSSPLWAEGWTDFGWLGVIALLALLGIAARRLDIAYERAISLGAMTSSIAAVAGTALLAGYLFIILRGPLLQSAARLVVLLLLLGAVHLLSRPSQRARAQVGELR